MNVTSASYIPNASIHIVKVTPLMQDLSIIPESRIVALDAIRTILTEENTDEIIDLVLAKVNLPLWLRWLPLGRVLDQLLPEAILGVFEDILGR